MADRQTLLEILNRDYDLEKMAEDNARKILVDLEVNGYKEAIKKIEMDEIKHQKIVSKLIKLLG